MTISVSLFNSYSLIASSSSTWFEIVQGSPAEQRPRSQRCYTVITLSVPRQSKNFNRENSHSSAHTVLWLRISVLQLLNWLIVYCLISQIKQTELIRIPSSSTHLVVNCWSGVNLHISRISLLNNSSVMLGLMYVIKISLKFSKTKS